MSVAWSIESAFLEYCGTSPEERRRAVIRVASALPRILRAAQVRPGRDGLHSPEWVISSLRGPSSNAVGDPERTRSELVVALRPSVSPDDNRGILSIYEGSCNQAGSFVGDAERFDIADAGVLEYLDGKASAVQTEPMNPAFLYKTDLLIPRLAQFGADHARYGIAEGMIAAIGVPAVVEARPL